MAKSETENYTHVIDWDKVSSLDDIKDILKGLEMKINPEKCSSKLKRFITKAEVN